MAQNDDMIKNCAAYELSKIPKKHLDPILLQQIDDLKSQVEKLTIMVNQLYYPYRSDKE
jgi:hypothetical protein